MRRLFEPEVFHTENYKKLYNNVCVDSIIKGCTPYYLVYFESLS